MKGIKITVRHPISYTEPLSLCSVQIIIKTFLFKEILLKCTNQIVAIRGGRINIDSTVIEYQSDDVIKMNFLKLWDLSGYSEKTMSNVLLARNDHFGANSL